MVSERAGAADIFCGDGVFNVFPLPRSAGFRRSFQHAGAALDHGYHVLVFPEGRLGRWQVAEVSARYRAAGRRVECEGAAGRACGTGRDEAGQRAVVSFGQVAGEGWCADVFAPELSAEEITERLRTEIARLTELMFD